MKLSMREKSECLRGFLLLIAQDRVVSPEERELLRHIGRALDFEKSFCEEALDDLLENAHISTSPPVFSQREHAEAFLRDCVRIAGADREIHPDELKWLTQIAEANQITASWVEEIIRRSPGDKTTVDEKRMEIEAFI